jgi:hypothetical protein
MDCVAVNDVLVIDAKAADIALSAVNACDADSEVFEYELYEALLTLVIVFEIGVLKCEIVVPST